MLQIDNHEEKALSVVIPYLLQFPEIYGLAKNSGTRYQALDTIVKFEGEVLEISELIGV